MNHPCNYLNSAGQLEEIYFSSVYLDTSCHFSQERQDVQVFVDDMCNHLFNNAKNLDEKRDLIRRDVELLVEECPQVRRIVFNLGLGRNGFGISAQPQLADTMLWRPLCQLRCLEDATVMASKWIACKAVLSHITHRLRRLKVIVTKRQHFWDNEVLNMYCLGLKKVLKESPELEELTIEVSCGQPIHFPADNWKFAFLTLRILSIKALVTKETLHYIWAHAPNLRTIEIYGFGVEGAIVPERHILFDEDDVARLVQTSPMLQLTAVDIGFYLKSMRAARRLINGLRVAKTIRYLSVLVVCEREDYSDREQFEVALGRVKRDMRQFEAFCHQRRKLFGTQIYWEWRPVGVGQDVFEML